MRRSGIPTVGHLPWRAHFCLLYEDKQDLIATLIPYFQAGLEDHEYCLWITSGTLSPAEARAALAQRVAQLDDYLATGQIDIVDSLGNAGLVDAALKRGFDGLRVSVHSDCLHGVISERRMLTLCAYSVAKCNGVQILDVQSHHDFGIVRRGGDWQLVESAGRKRSEEPTLPQDPTVDAIRRIFSDSLLADSEEEVGRACLDVAKQATGSTFGFLAERNSAGGLQLIATSGTSPAAARMPLPTLIAGGIDGRVALPEKAFFANELPGLPDWIAIPEDHPPISTFLAAPLQYDGKTIGMLTVANRCGGYQPAHVECVEALSMATVQVLLRKRAERAVLLAEERFRHAQKMESIGLLAGGIAHDFNNLVTSILGNASLLEMRNGRKVSAVRTIIKCGERAAALTRQLLAYAGKGSFERADFDVSRLLRSCPDLIRVSIPKNVDIELDVPRALPAVNGDLSQIQQVVMNLVINAAEAIGDRTGGKVSIRSAVRSLDRSAAGCVASGFAPGRYVELAVEDNGCGMAAGTMARIFEPFFSTKVAGRGLGLAAVRDILANHNGAITVESRVGRGSTFTVYLPCREARVSASRRRDRVHGGRGATVLIVDDENDICEYGKVALTHFGYKVLTAGNGREAVDLLARRRDVCAVVLDVVMPVMGGVEALSEIRNRWPGLAVVLASGYGREEAGRMGIPDDTRFIGKPYTLQELAAAVEAIVKTTRAGV